MKRLILLAGAATLAVATAAYAGPGGGHGGPHGGGGGGNPHFAAGPVKQRGGGGGGGHAAVAPPAAGPRFAAGGGARANFHASQPRMFAARGGGGHAEHGPAMHAQAQMHERQQVRTQRVQQAQAQRHMRTQQAQAQRQMHAQQAQAQRQMHVQQAQAQRQMHAQQAQARMAQRQQMQANRQLQVQNRMAARQQIQGERMAGVNNGVGYGVGGCPPGLASKGCMPPGLANHEMAIQNRLAVQQQLAGVGMLPVQQRIAAIQNLGPNRFTTLAYAPQTQILDPFVASDLVGVPVSSVGGIVPLGALPQPIAYLYPQTPQYYYQYSPGYVYQIDRNTSLIDALIPLLAGGYMPGSYLPSAYMSSYVPDYYGYDSFYPASYGYGNLCNRYAYGVVYQVDCATGFVENVIPTYAGGYGVGQMLPTAYDYYNVPYQYRSLYPASADMGYWYAPGAIYQYDPSTSLITSVAALLSPGLTIGQPLPAGYDIYNVPIAYRASYYDTPTAWYRYNNGYIYQVDPATQLVTAIVASALT